MPQQAVHGVNVSLQENMSSPPGRPSNSKFYYPVDISTTVFSYSRAMQYHMILHSAGVIARVLLHARGYAVS